MALKSQYKQLTGEDFPAPGGSSKKKDKKKPAETQNKTENKTEGPSKTQLKREAKVWIARCSARSRVMSLCRPLKLLKRSRQPRMPKQLRVRRPLLSLLLPTALSPLRNHLRVRFQPRCHPVRTVVAHRSSQFPALFVPESVSISERLACVMTAAACMSPVCVISGTPSFQSDPLAPLSRTHYSHRSRDKRISSQAPPVSLDLPQASLCGCRRSYLVHRHTHIARCIA